MFEFTGLARLYAQDWWNAGLETNITFLEVIGVDAFDCI